ncbi:MAG: hypothetical protein K2M79_06480 [Muribaculaceae bacterium]|nr:hypothetical protein [Muribaculaceae bacterium]
MSRKVKYTAAAILCTALLSGCNSGGCLDNQSALPKAQLYNSQGEAISVDSLQIRGVGAPGDSVLEQGRLSTFYLPMRSDAGVTSWEVAYLRKEQNPTGVCDTIEFSYRSIPYFESADCGATFRYLVTQVNTTHHFIEDVVMTDSLITNVDRTYINIILRTADEQ